MTEQSKMPARIWVNPIAIFSPEISFSNTVVREDSIDRQNMVFYEQFIRADLVEQLAEALRAAIAVAGEAREEWDRAPSGMKAGKLLIALSEPSLKYRADITAIHAALSTYAAAVGSKEITS